MHAHVRACSRLWWMSRFGRKDGQFVFICTKRSHPNVDVRSFMSRSHVSKAEPIACSFRLVGTWISYSQSCAVSLLLSNYSLVNIVLALHYILLTSFMGLTGILPTISEYYFALSKTGLSCLTWLTWLKRGAMLASPFML